MAAPLPSPPVHVDLRAILSESKRIISVHPCHFLALSVLFLLPIYFASSAARAIYQLCFLSSAPTNVEERFRFLINPWFLIKTLIFTLLSVLFALVFTLLATGSITYSVFHGFYGRPVNLVPAIKSAFTSFFRLLSTWLTIQLIIFGILLIFGLLLFSLVKATQLLGFQVDFSSTHFASLCLFFVTIFVSIVVYLQVNWSFAYVIVVVESSRGLEPLNRSQNLVKGLKGVAFLTLLFFWFLGWLFSWGFALGWGDSAADDWKNWAFVLNIVVTSTLLMLHQLYNLAAMTVSYTYSKAIHGELAGEYVSLPPDGGKVLEVVSVV